MKNVGQIKIHWLQVTKIYHNSMMYIIKKLEYQRIIEKSLAILDRKWNSSKKHEQKYQDYKVEFLKK